MPRWRPFVARFFLPRAEGGQVDGLDRHLQRLLVARLVVHEADRRGVGEFVDQVAAADIDRVDAEGGGRLVHQAFEREGDHRPRHAAIGRHGAGVGEHAARAALIGAEIVRPRQLRHGHQRLDAAGGRETGIGADIGDHVGLERDQLGVLVEGAGERDGLVAAVKGGDQVLAPVLGPGHRTLELARQPHQHDVFGRERHLLAEAAADVGRDHAQIGLRHAEHVGDGGAHEMRHLRGAGQRHAAGRRIEGGVAGARLHRRRVLPVRARVEFDDFCRAAPDRIEVGGS